MRNTLLFLAWIGLILGCQPDTNTQEHRTYIPLEPTGIIGDDLDPKRDSLKRAYQRDLVHAAPGTDVTAIERTNRQENLRRKQTRRLQRSSTETFANGAITANWHERGPTNEAGDMREVWWDAANEHLYAIAVGGSFWRGDLNGNWTLLDDDRQYNGGVLTTVPHNGGHRMFACIGSGKKDKLVSYSDDLGSTWTEATGLGGFYDHWGEGKAFYPLNDPNVIFYVVHTWWGNPWGQRFFVYLSTDKGQSYQEVWNTPVGYSGQRVATWKREGADVIHLFDHNSEEYLQITYDAVNQQAVIGTPVSYAAANLHTGNIAVTGEYNSTTGMDDLYLVTNDDKKVYRTNNGSTFTHIGTTTETVWRKSFMADPDSDNMYIGGFQMSRSLDNGTNWNDLYSYWWTYYDKNLANNKNNLHVDQMNLYRFEKTDGTPFLIILNHAGIFVSYDGMNTTTNLGLNGLNVTTLYDQTTAADGFFYGGAQDKGSFTIDGTTTDFAPFATNNITTGDGMLGIFYNNEQSIVTMLQNGGFQIRANRATGAGSSGFNIPGNHKSGWINPMVATPDLTDNTFYVAGGNLNGGDGCYLIRCEPQINSSTSHTLLTSQYNYDFRANSDNGTSNIKALGVSPADANRLYVATSDGTFFHSTDQGANWTKSTYNFPNGFLPWEIITSATDADEVYISGNGYSNAGVFRSTDGGATFTALDTDLPSARVSEVALDGNEDFLFAATSAGPYVYSMADQRWHSLVGGTTPLVDYNSVDYIGSDVVRFGTYGRGVWDFEMTSAVLPADLLAFRATPQDNVTVSVKWTTANEVNLDNYTVEHALGNDAFRPLERIRARGGEVETTYRILHRDVEPGEHYYRLRINDLDGAYEYSDVVSVRLTNSEPNFTIYPNPLPANGALSFRTELRTAFTLELFDANGRSVFRREGVLPEQTVAPKLPAGSYFYRATATGRSLAEGMLVVR